MKVEIEKEFRYEGELYGAGDVVDLPEGVAKSVIKKNYAHAEDEAPNLDKNVPEIGSEESPEPELSTPSDNEDEIFSKLDNGLSGEITGPSNKWNPPQDNPPEPSEHPDLKGQVLGISSSQNYDTRFANVRLKSGEVKTVYEHTVLDNLFDAMEKGDYVGVSFAGKEEDKNYLKYRYTLYSPNGNEKLSNTG